MRNLEIDDAARVNRVLPCPFQQLDCDEDEGDDDDDDDENYALFNSWITIDEDDEGDLDRGEDDENNEDDED